METSTTSIRAAISSRRDPTPRGFSSARSARRRRSTTRSTSIRSIGLHRSYRFPNPTSPTSIQSSRGYDNPFFTLNNPGNKQRAGRVDREHQRRVDAVRLADREGDARRRLLQRSASRGAAAHFVDRRRSADVMRYDLNNLEIDNNLIATADPPDQRQHRSDGVGRSEPELTSFPLDIHRGRQPEGSDAVLAAEHAHRPRRPSSTRWRTSKGTSGRPRSALYNQLYLMGRLRNDGYSTFGASKRRNNFPAFTAAWTFTNFLHNEDHKGILSFGKLRFAYGETGKEPPVYSAITALSTGSTRSAAALVISSTLLRAARRLSSPRSSSATTPSGPSGRARTSTALTSDSSIREPTLGLDLVQQAVDGRDHRGSGVRCSDWCHPAVRERGVAHQQGCGDLAQRASLHHAQRGVGSWSHVRSQ